MVFPLKPWGKTKTDILRVLKNSDFGKLIAQNVTSKDIIKHCVEWGAAPSTVNHHYIFIRAVYLVAEDLLGCKVKFSEVEKVQATMRWRTANFLLAGVTTFLRQHPSKPHSQVASLPTVF